MDFFYPNFNNDFWRVMGLVHFGDASRFVAPSGRRFNYEAVVEFCRGAGLAFYDTASKVNRLKDNASDAFLEILEPTDVGALLARLPDCRTVVTTGGKASAQFAELLGADNPGVPEVGGCADVVAFGRAFRWWRMPSTSRAYPLPLPAKASAAIIAKNVMAEITAFLRT